MTDETEISSGQWTDKERALFSVLRSTCTTEEIHKVFTSLGYNRTRDAICRRGRRIGIRFTGLGEPDINELDIKEVSAVETIIRDRGELSTGEEETEIEEESRLWAPPVRVPRLVVQATVEDLLNKLKEIRDSTPRTKATAEVRPAQGSGTTAVVLLSDLHFGNKTETFNVEIASQRIQNLADRLVPSLPKDCNEIVLAIGGDVVEGEEIYPTQQSRLDQTLIHQVHAATKSLWVAMVSLVNKGYKVRVHTCPGNHGRMSKTAHETSNWDNVVYMQLGLLADMYAHPDLRVEVNFEEFVRFPLRDKWAIMYHRGVRHVGTPAMKYRLAGWMKKFEWDIFLHGHHHQWGVNTLFGKPVVHNGSLVGPDDLAARMGEDDPPRQAYFLARENEPFSGFGFIEWSK